MFIDVTNIRKDVGKNFHFDLEEDIRTLILGNDRVVFHGPLRISLDVKNTGKIIQFSGTLEGDTELVCSRCIEQYPYKIKLALTENFCHLSDAQDLSEEVRDPEDVHIFEGNKIEFGEIIRENLYLNIPMKSVCNESCKGLCIICGTNLNKETCKCKKEELDPRMEVLKKYFDH